MMKHNALVAAAVLSLATNTSPLVAQGQAVPELPVTISDDPTAAQAEELGAISSLFGDMFGGAEPLSPEEEARVGAAMQVVTKLFPEGTYAKMMEESMAPMLEGMMGGLGGSPAFALVSLTGLDLVSLQSIDEDRLAAAVALLDPAAAERNAAMGEAMFALISEVVVEIEPAYRAGLARAYAVRFSEDELTDLAAYFKTPVGEKYAAESFLIFADPQVMASMNEVMPVMMQRMPALFETMGEVGSEFPEGRTFSALGGDERAELAVLLGVSEEELAQAEPAVRTTNPIE
ncbi:DUF2059 domain-containing protein [uncultured Erythrobacter sp.]|uniref:DUF2059 domain-containing protein n=1 Tax=uncultured Erythrobacter sp. TaxID=263913 RepID=UPI002609C329|nr:DUF2059 domain-containing protein [uncultured Erythrobacter sp.]